MMTYTLLFYGQESEYLTLGAGETRAYKVPLDIQEVEISVSSGKVETFFFKDKPELTKTFNITEEFERTLDYNYYIYYAYFMNEGSIMRVNWSTFTEAKLHFYILKGEEQIENFENDDFYEYIAYHPFEKNLSIEYMASSTDTYAFAWENFDKSDKLFIEFNLTRKIHDVSTAAEKREGTFQLEISEKGYSYMVIANPSNTSQAEIYYNFKDSSAQFGPIIFGAIIAVVIAIVIVIVVVRKKNKAGQPQQQSPPSGTQVGTPYVPQNPQNWNPQGGNNYYGGSSPPAYPGYGNMPPPSYTTPDAQTSRPGINTSQYGQNLGQTSSFPQTDYRPTAIPITGTKGSPQKCPTCQTPLDRETASAVAKQGYAFCSYCGSKIE